MSSSMLDLSDDELMALAKRGSSEAFEVIVRRHEPAILAIAASRLRCLERAKDAVQSSFLDLYRALDRYRPCGKFRAFLFRIVANRCRMSQRSLARSSRIESALEALDHFEQRPPDLELIERERIELLRRSVTQLSPKLRSVVELRVRGLSYEEIAAELGLPTGTVKSRICLGSRALRMLMQTACSAPRSCSSAC